MHFDQHWFSVSGLLLDLIGASIIIRAGHISQKAASLVEYKVSLNTTYQTTGRPDELVAILDLLVQSSKSCIKGFWWVVVGAGLQIIGTWPIN